MVEEPVHLQVGVVELVSVESHVLVILLHVAQLVAGDVLLAVVAEECQVEQEARVQHMYSRSLYAGEVVLGQSVYVQIIGYGDRAVADGQTEVVARWRAKAQTINEIVFLRHIEVQKVQVYLVVQGDGHSLLGLIDVGGVRREEAPEPGDERVVVYSGLYLLHLRLACVSASRCRQLFGGAVGRRAADVRCADLRHGYCQRKSHSHYYMCGTVKHGRGLIDNKAKLSKSGTGIVPFIALNVLLMSLCAC